MDKFEEVRFMPVGSILHRIRRPLVGAALASSLAAGLLVAAAPAQASISAPKKVDVTWQAATGTNHGGAGTEALCFPPTRYVNGAVWDCQVFSGEVIYAWMICSGTYYQSPPIGEGSWWIVGICPAGTVRDDEGIIDN